MTDVDRREPATRTLGQLLRAARESAGQSVEQVSEATRIRATLVRDLESDNLASSGGAVYARGHVKAIAHALGVDAGPLVAQHDRQAGVSVPPASHPAPVPSPRAASSRLSVPLSAPAERRSPRWAVAGTVGLAVLVALLAVGTAGDDTLDSTASAALPSAAPVAPSPPAAAARPKAAPRPTTALLVMRATGASWVSVSSGGKTVFEGLVQEGWKQRFEDPRSVRVRIGNGGGMRVACGGGEGGTAGATGEVLTLECTPAGLKRS